MYDDEIEQRPRSKWLYVTLTAQWIVVGAVAFLPFGFDHPSSWGLDFEDYLKALLLLGGFTIASLAIAAAGRDAEGALYALIPPLVVFFFPK